MSSVYRINIPVPECGWLTNAEPLLHVLGVYWGRSAARAAVAARTPTLRQASIRAIVRDSTTPRRVLVAEDVRPSLGAALHGLVAAGVLTGSDRRYVVADSLELGPSMGDLEPLLVLELTEVRSDG